MVEQRKRNGMPLYRKRSTIRQCGTCNVSWSECECEETDATESINSILASCKGLGDKEHLWHMNVFVYFSYRRWSAPYTARNVSPAAFPPFEGWYPAWIQPARGPAVRIKGFEDSVIEVLLRFHDATSMDGFITREGELIVANPAASPRNGVYLNGDDEPLLQMDVMPVARMFTLDEIVSGGRGRVHGSAGGCNNGRKVSHIVRDDGVGGYDMLKYPERDYAAVDVVTVAKKKVKEFVPQYVEEYRSRRRRQFTKAVVRSIHPYLESFLEQTRASDLEQRAAQSPVGSGPTTKALLKEVVLGLGVLNDAVQASASAGDGAAKKQP